jgi:hypothetical protein
VKRNFGVVSRFVVLLRNPKEMVKSAGSGKAPWFEEGCGFGAVDSGAEGSGAGFSC